MVSGSYEPFSRLALGQVEGQSQSLICLFDLFRARDMLFSNNVVVDQDAKVLEYKLAYK